MSKKQFHPDDEIKMPIGGLDKRMLFGVQGMYLRQIEDEFDVRVVSRGETLSVYGKKDAIQRVHDLLKIMIDQINRGGTLSQQSLRYAIDIVRKDERLLKVGDLNNQILVNKHHQPIVPRSEGQRRYVKAIFSNDMVFVIGPAGTGKTYLAVACAVRQLKDGFIDRIILVRPAVDAEESLGFLPGDIEAKISPYLRPIYDALYEMLPRPQMERYLIDGTVEIAPLAFMRGRTLNNSFIILDEAQNSTTGQMQMFLTRLGMNSKTIITGDITQIDLKDKSRSGLVQVQSVLKGIPSISFTYMDQSDVVRHPLVQDIVLAYERFNKKKNMHRNDLSENDDN